MACERSPRRLPTFIGRMPSQRAPPAASGRGPPPRAPLPIGDAIELERRHAELRFLLQTLQHLGDDLAGAPHALQIFLGFELELHQAALRSWRRISRNTSSVVFEPPTSRSRPFRRKCSSSGA